MDIFKKFFPFVVILIFTIPTIRPLFIKGYFPIHDDTQPARVYEMHKSLNDGQFPVRWVDGLGYGYGYPIFNFYAPLPYYVGAIGMFAGMDALSATKFMFGVGILFSGIFMLLLAKRLWGNLGGLISAVLYLYFPYHALEVYVRGAVGEYWAYAFLPLVFLGIHMAQNREKWGIFVGSIGLAATILSHNILGILTVGVVLCSCFTEALRVLFAEQPKTNVLILISIFLLGVSLSAFFWLPAVVEMKYTRAHMLVEGTNDFRQHFVYLDQLWDSPWGYAGSGPGRTDGISFKIGKLHLFLGIVGFLLAYFFNKKEKTKRWGLILLGGALISLFMMLPQSQPVWELIPFFPYIQYPWRFLVWVGFCLSLLGGGILSAFIKKEWVVGSTVMILLLTVIVNTKYFQPQTILPLTANDYVEQEKMHWTISKISDEYLPESFPIPQKIEETTSTKFIFSDDIIVESSEVKVDRLKLNVSLKNRAEIAFLVTPFPGWQAVVDTRKIDPEIRGRSMVIPLEAGKHVVSLNFTNTWVRVLGNGISLVGIVLLLVLYQRTQA